jgi:hypothetical protein
MFGFVAGAIAGGLAVYFYRDRLKEMLDDSTQQARTKAAEGLESVAARAESALDAAREQVRSGVQTGQEYLRPGASEPPRSPNTYR